MKALDTPILEALLRGDPAVRGLLKRLEGEELCTTVVNLYELESIARSDPSAGRERRLGAIERLRRKLTVVDVDARAAAAAADLLARSRGRASRGTEPLILGALEAAGCGELLTISDARVSGGTKGLKVTNIDH